MRATTFAANTSAFSITKRFHRVLLLSVVFLTASLSSWAQNMTVSTPSVTFTTKEIVGTTSASKPVTITNNTASTQSINILMSGNFTESDNCGGSVAGNGSCTANIFFTPTLAGSISGAATIYDNSHNLLAYIGLKGTGEAPVTASPASLSFTGGTVGTQSAAKTFQITNNTTGAVTINSITTNVSDYTITTGTCLTTALPGAGSCTVSVTVTPTSAADDGAIIITDNAANSVPQVIKLTSAATAGTSPITLSKATLTFKTLSGTTSAIQTVTVTNTSAGTVALGTITASADFAISSTTCTSSLAPGGKCTFGIEFQPTFVGTIEGAAAVPFTTSSSNSPQLVNLTGTSEVGLTVAPASLTFSSQGVGTTAAAKAVVITNNSATAATLSSVVPSGDFQIQLSGTTCSLTGGTLLGGKTCSIEIQFAPTVGGAIVGALTVTNNSSPDPLLIALAGTGSAPLSVATKSLSGGTIGTAYNQTLQASGGTPPYTWSISSGVWPTGLSLTAGTGAITGKPTTAETFNFTVKVTDSAANTATDNLSISINPALTITTTSPLLGGSIGAQYNQTVNATGGIQPYNWSIGTGKLPAGLSLSASGTITGTPRAAGTFKVTVKVTDSTEPTSSTATASLSITVGKSTPLSLPAAGALANATVNQSYSGAINASGGMGPNYTFTVNGATVPTNGTTVSLGNGSLAVSNTGGNALSIGGTPTSPTTVSFTVSVKDSASNIVGPYTYTIAVVNPVAAYTVSGTVSYSGSKTGWIYLQLNGNNCGGCGNNMGTSISEATLTSGGAFTIHGVQPGTYTLQAYMDNLGYGAENASNPTGSVSNVTVTNSGLSGVSVVLTDPAAVTLSSAPAWKSSDGSGAFNGGAFVSFQTIQNNGIEMPASYTVQWSTSSSFTTIAGSKSFPATGQKNPWIVSGLTNGDTYYFRAQGVAGSSTSNWSAPSSATTIGAPTGANTVSGTVTFSETATGPLYVGFYDQNTGNVYADVVGSQANPPTSPAAFTVQVPNGSNYFFFGVLDQNNSGLISGPGQVSNTNGNNTAPVVITGNLSNQNLTLPSANSVATVMTQNSEQINSNGTNSSYGIGFNVNGLIKLPVAVELATGPTKGVVIPADIASGGFNGNSGQFSFWTGLNGATPKVGDTYTLNVTYSDGTSQILTVAVSAVLNAFATNLSPQGSGVSVTPTFSWTDPANASSYTYQFWVCCNSNGTIWQIPGNNSNSNGFSSSITSITWGTDPTNSGNPPSVPSLNGSTTYNWQIQASDVNGNSAQVQVSFETVATPLSLPAVGSVGTTVAGQNFNGAINASGGTGPSYTFTVNGSTVPTNGTQVSLGDGLYAFNTGGNTLSLSGTPTSAATVSFTASVTDSASNTIGPFTYTITVNAASPLAIQAMTLPNSNVGWAYYGSLSASGGSSSYTWSVISGSLPNGLSLSTCCQNPNLSGTPTATGTSNFTVEVTDTETPPATATATFSITVTGCTNNANLNGHYAFVDSGWNSSVFTTGVGSFVADGAGNISGGLADTNDSTNGPLNGTFTGTYCVSSNNLALITANYGGGLSGSHTFAAALDSSDGNGHIIAFDNSNLLTSGLLRKQQTTAFSTGEITGNYAFGIVGFDSGDSGFNRFGMAGQFNSNGSGTLAGEIDADDATKGPLNGTLSASNFNVASTGRGTVYLTFSGGGKTGPTYVFYVVNATEMLFMDDDIIDAGPLSTGRALQQSGTFTDASLTGVSVVESQALDPNNTPSTPDAQAGFLTANGSGTLSVNIDDNDGGTMTLGETSSGTYSVASNGRATLALTGETNAPVFYLIAPNQAFVIGTSAKVGFGTLTPQTGSNFTLASLKGSYLGGTQYPVDSNAKAQLIQIQADGAGNLVGNGDENDGQCNGQQNRCGGPGNSTFAGTYTVSSDGKVIVTSQGETQAYVYIISPSQAVVLPAVSPGNESSNPSLMDLLQ